MDEKPFYKIIEDLVEERKLWSDEQIVAELSNIQPLPDEFDTEGGILDSSEWDWAEANHSLIAHWYLYVAHADIAAIRQLDKSIPLLLERACYGDPGETMRGIFKNSLYYAAGKNVEKLADYCIRAYSSSRKGTRLWAVSTLSLYPLCDRPEVSNTLRLASQDPDFWVRSRAR